MATKQTCSDQRRQWQWLVVVGDAVGVCGSGLPFSASPRPLRKPETSYDTSRPGGQRLRPSPWGTASRSSTPRRSAASSP